MLTIQILVRNDRETIERTLESISNLNARILIGDLGSTDGSIDLCKKHKAEIVKIKHIDDFAKIRNELSSKDINFYLNPWEIIVSGKDEIDNINESCKVYVIQNGILSKEIRFWKDLKFKNPAYETIDCDYLECNPHIVISSIGYDSMAEEKIKICKAWHENRPTLKDACYYYAFSKLSKRDYSFFISNAEKYLAMGGNGMSAVMVHYNLAKVKFHLGRSTEAVKHLLICISAHPTFSEFWCLLGDMLFKQGKYSKAKSIYQNAIIIGKRRLNSDAYPIEISKYQDYPRNMIEKSKEMEKEISIIGSKK